MQRESNRERMLQARRQVRGMVESVQAGSEAVKANLLERAYKYTALTRQKARGRKGESQGQSAHSRFQN
eukprot:5669771-Pleurochrysis_carterae.AAC.1